ncbi:MAG: TRAP transporter substrate-binding protein DctP, partial [Pseudomonadota bacterium]
MKKFAKLALLSTAIVSFAGIEAYAASTNWNVSLWGKRRAFTEHVEKLAELVSAKTNGEFTLNISYGGLSKNRENLDGISIGAFEMAQFCAGYHRDKNRVITVLELPFLGVENLKQEVAVSTAVYSHPAATEEMKQWNAKLLMTSPMPQYNLVGTGEPRTELADFEGMRVRATGGLGQAFKSVGGVPTSVTATEAYQAMESGVVDTVAFAQHAHLSFGTINQAKWWTANLNPGTVNCPVVVNIDAYEALSPEHREALDSSVTESLDHYLANYGDLLERWDSVLAEKGVKKV